MMTSVSCSTRASARSRGGSEDAGSVEVDSVDSGSVEVSLLTEVGLSPAT